MVAEDGVDTAVGQVARRRTVMGALVKSSAGRIPGVYSGTEALWASERPKADPKNPPDMSIDGCFSFAPLAGCIPTFSGVINVFLI